jgi:hypothetical protein
VDLVTKAFLQRRVEAVRQHAFNYASLFSK